MPVARLEQVAINYMQFGRELTGEPLIMLHGMATNLAFWYPLAPIFAADRPVLLFDLRGHGRSSMPESGYAPHELAEDLGLLLDYLEIEKAHFLAHSFGGSVLLNFAYHHPERVKSLLLADVRVRILQPSQCPKDWSHWPRLKNNLEKVGIHLDEDDPEGGYHLLETMMRWELTAKADGPMPFPKLLAQLVPQIGSKRTAERWLNLIETTQAKQGFKQGENITVADLAQMHKPTLAVYGENSPALPSAQALQELWPHGRYEVIANAGHFFPLSKPEKLVIAAQEFLSEFSCLSR